MAEKQGNSNKTVEIRPGVGFYRLIPALRYKSWVALGEMVDNSIQSFDKNRDTLYKLHGASFKLIVEIEFGRGDNPWIAVKDNAAGIPESEFDRAFEPAAPPVDRSGISQYGIGMKSSACWFSQNFFIRTKALGEDTQKVVNFNIPMILELSSDRLDVLEVPKDVNDHGTTIEMRNLLQPLPTGTALAITKNYLRSMYREWLRSGELQLIVAGEKLSYTSPKWLVEPYWPSDAGVGDGPAITWIKDIDVELNESWASDLSPEKTSMPPRVTGFVAILEKGSTKTAGLSLVWRKKVVQGAGAEAQSQEDLYRPAQIYGGVNAFERQRLFGELDVSDLRVTSFKDAINWAPGQEEELIKKVLEQITTPEKNLKKMSANYRAMSKNPKIQKKIDAAVDQTAKDLMSSLISKVEEGAAPGQLFTPEVTDEEDRDIDLGVPSAVSTMVLKPVFSSDLAVIVTENPGDPAWLRVIEDEGIWKIVMNRDHPFMNSFSAAVGPEFDALFRVACALGIAEITGKQAGRPDADFIRTQVNSLLRGRLSSRESLEEV